MITLGIILLAFVATGLFISMIVVDAPFQGPKPIKNVKAKELPKAVAKTSIQEVLSEHLRNPPIGCMWEVTRNKRTVRANNYNNKMKDVYTAHIKLINPLDELLEFVLVLHDETTSSNRIKSFEDELTYNLQIVTSKYKRMVLASETKQDLEDGWDGVYN